jgi:cellobiose phosphorylase
MARDTLKLLAGVQDAESGQFWYAFGGYGDVQDALSLHSHPSDLDLYFMWGVAEFISATADWAFLNESVAFHPQSSSSLPPGASGLRVIDHVCAAFTHLYSSHMIGLGEHGLLRLRDGDWDDGVALTDPNPFAVEYTEAYGESIPNSQQVFCFWAFCFCCFSCLLMRFVVVCSGIIRAAAHLSSAHPLQSHHSVSRFSSR